MAFVESSNKGSFNGVTEITLVAAPAASTRRIIKNINIANIDTASVAVAVKLKDGAAYKIICIVILDSGDILIYDDVIVLKAPTESIVGVLSGAPATTNPDFVASYGDAS